MFSRIALADLASLADAVIGEALADDSVRGLTDDDLVSTALAASVILRRIEGLLMDVADEIGHRSNTVDGDRIDLAYGCRNATQLLELATGVAPRTARLWQRTARAVRGRVGLLGDDLPPVLPGLRAEMVAGTVGLDAVVAASTPLVAIRDRVTADDLLAADAAVADAVRSDPSAGTFDAGAGEQIRPACADALKVHAVAWAAALDQDGAEPVEARAIARRSLNLGRLNDGLVRVTGDLLPDVAGQLQRIIDAVTNPRLEARGVRFRDDGEIPVDQRTVTQRRHDALATALSVAARSGDLPNLGGAAPTLVVTVSADAMRTGRGHAEIAGVPVPLSIATHVACGGVIQRVMFENGRITAIGTEERVFNHHQRRAIVARDRTCILPGCETPAAWCEIHHVTEWSRGGPTHTDNGVLICWHHHRFLDRTGWEIRMRDGVPEVRPPQWMDRERRWRAARAPDPVVPARC